MKINKTKYKNVNSEILPETFKNHQVVTRNSPKHRLWALEAVKIAEKVLPIFEKENLEDNRPCLAIKAIKSWAQGKRELGMKEVRKLSLGAHAAARECKTDAARFVARAAGHAVATWHVPTHAIGAPRYARKAIMALSEQSKSVSLSKEVDLYIAQAPKELQPKLSEIRKIIKQIAPQAVESMSYRMPHYSYKGQLAWFALMKNHIGLYLPPPVVAEHDRDLIGYKTTKSSVHFPLDKKLPVNLIKKLVRARIKKNEANNKGVQ